MLFDGFPPIPTGANRYHRYLEVSADARRFLTDPHGPPQIPAVHHRPLSSFYHDGIIVSHFVGPVVLAHACSPKMSQDGTE